MNTNFLGRRVVALILPLLAFMPSATRADDQLCDGTTVITSPPSKALPYTRGELLAEIERLYGAPERATVDSALNGVTLGELDVADSDAVGMHDKDTVGLDARDHDTGGIQMTKEEAAVTLRHESQHVGRAKGASGGKDPFTQGLNCGGCFHSEMHSSEILDMTVNCDELKETLLGLPELIRICRAMKDSLDVACFWLDSSRCSESNLVCPGTNGMSRGEEAKAMKDLAKKKMEACCGK